MKNKNIARVVGSSAHSLTSREKNDYYATDPNVLDAFLKQYGKLHEHVWECACGEGNLSNRLSELGYQVFASDLINYNSNKIFDFTSDPNGHEILGDILTNPPYKHAQTFVENGLSRVQDGNKVILLLRIQFLESQQRYKLFEKHPPKEVYVHSSRIGIYKNNDKEKYGKSNALCFAWFVWEKGYEGATTLKWIP